MRQAQGYWAFVPALLPVKPPIDTGTLSADLEKAVAELARLDGIATTLPAPDLFVAMHMRVEALLSSRIEGTQTGLVELLEDEAGEPPDHPERVADVGEVRNYIAAMRHGLAQLQKLPLSLRLLREVHHALLSGVRGEDKSPGEFRTTQNAIGPKPLASYDDAKFVPPPPDRLPDLLANFERYVNDDAPTPVLVRVAVAHAQFETIHPFNDGNGRLGRLLMTFMLCHRGLLREPLLYLSEYFERDREAYYGWLMRVREEGDWEGWVRYVLRGIEDVARQSAATARNVLELREQHRAFVQQHLPRRASALKLLDLLVRKPVISVKRAAEDLGVTVMTANGLVADFVQLGLLRELTGRRRDRVFMYLEFVKRFDRSVSPKQTPTV